jgi:NAD-dependent deacetylase
MNITDLPLKFFESLSLAKNVTVLTGAGISAESGIKTFRDPDGLWSKFNPAELASMDGFMSNPKLVWDWYQYRREIINSAQPNPGHFAIAEMQNLFPNFKLITQNVDRLHQRSGSEHVIELHGNIIENYCVKCNAPFMGNFDTADKVVPKCKNCNGLIRPAVVWFGEMLPVDALKNAEIASKKSDFFFSIGTSAEVYPAANLPLLAKSSGAVVIEINPNETAISGYMDYTFKMPSGEALPILINEIKKIRGLK